jgi:phage shock protein B
MEDVWVPIIVIPVMFIALPWLILHYITKWKQAPRMTNEDENLLDEMHMLARRLEDRLNTIERIVAADNPDWRPGLNAPDRSLGINAPQTNYQLDRRN